MQGAPERPRCNPTGKTYGIRVDAPPGGPLPVSRVSPTPRPAPAPLALQGSSALIRSVRWSIAVRLMDSLVHDVRNPLNALAINVEILQEKLSRAAGGEVPPGQAKNLHAMREQIARVNGMLGEFARFLAPAPGAPEVVSLSSTVKDAIAVLAHAGRRAR